MKNLNLKKLNKKQAGFILTSEAVLLSTVLVIGMTAGLVTLRDALTAELEDVAEAVGSLDQSYAYDGIQNDQNTAFVSGSAFGDAVDTAHGDRVSFSYVAADEDEGSSVTASTIAAGTPGTL